jgi:hypothetical protein
VLRGSASTWSLETSCGNHGPLLVMSRIHIPIISSRHNRSCSVLFGEAALAAVFPRANVVGEITLSAINYPWFPAPDISVYSGGKTWS